MATGTEAECTGPRELSTSSTPPDSGPAESDDREIIAVTPNNHFLIDSATDCTSVYSTR